MAQALAGHPDLPLAHNASFRVEQTTDGIWIADDPEVECFAEGDDPNAAVAALLEAEREYLAILQAQQALSPLLAEHLRILSERTS